jgi:hypothetical protein
MNSKNKNIRDLYRGINIFKRDYKPRSNLVKDENCDLLADSSNIVNRWKSYFSQFLNIHNVRQIEIHTAEPLVPGLSHLEVEIVIAKLKKYKSLGIDQIPAELIQAGGETLVSVIHKLITSIWNKEELPDLWKESITVAIHKMGDKTDCNNYHGISLLSTSYKMLFNVLSQISAYIDEIIGDHQCNFDVTDQLLISFSAFVRYWSTMRQ